MAAFSRQRELLPLLLLCCVIATACFAFFGTYAFDDSFVGYGTAQSLLDRTGFSFNGGDRVLSTSAPLAVPLYALIAFVTHGSVVFAAQFCSALALAAIAFGSYFLARRWCSPVGAFAAAVTLTCTPFVLLLWSHETLLYAACTIAGLLLYVRGRTNTAAIVLGCAVLLRGEALLLLPFLWYAQARTRGVRAGAVFALISLAPVLLWAAFALAYFDSAFSHTIASKRAQLRYQDITPYLDGLRDYVTRMYALTPTALWALALEIALALCAAVAVACGIFSELFIGVVLWSLIVSALYVVLQMPFYFWFCSQLGVLLAAGAAIVWPNRPPVRFPLLLTLGRAASLVIVAINAGFLLLQIQMPERKMISYDWIVMPDLRGNAYRSIGELYAQLKYAGASVAYPEFGQIGYYAHGNADVVDYLGIVTPGAARELAADNAVWTFKRYRPTDVIDSANFRYFVSPVEYDWFWNAYRPWKALKFSGDPSRSRFTVYRLRQPGAVPPATERDDGAQVVRVDRNARALSFTFDPSSRATGEVEARVAIPPGCRSIRTDLFSGSRHEWRTRSIPPSTPFARITMQFARPLPRARYRYALSGCSGLAAAPSARLRTGFIWLGKPAAPPARPQDSLVVYRTKTVP